MMSAESLYCDLCEEFLVEPKDLPCKHSFCRTCLLSHCLSHANEDGFPCPKCSKPVKAAEPFAPITEWADSIPTNDATSKRLEKVLMMEKEKKQMKCIMCHQKWKAIRATKYCKSCAEHFCDECGNQHWLLRASKEHRVWLIDDLSALEKDSMLRARLVLIFNAKSSPTSAIAKQTVPNPNENGKDSENCDISGATFLDNGYIVIADKGNGKVKLFNKQYHYVTSYPVKNCHDVLAINQYFVVVSSPDKRCIRYLSVFESVIKEDSVILTDSECYGMCHVGDKFAISLSGLPMFILIYGGKKLLDTVKVGDGKVRMTHPYYIAYSKKNDIFIISDEKNSSLKCVKKNGDLVWDKKISNCQGLTLFENYILLARSDRKTVDIINSIGQIIKSVVTVYDGLSKVRTICVDFWKVNQSTSNRLVVTDDSGLVRMFVIEDPLMDDELKMYFSKSKSTLSESSIDKNNDGNIRTCNIL